MRAFLVTGTDTGVGKTTVTRALAAYFSLRKRLNVGVMKPFETGVSPEAGGRLSSDAAALKEAAGVDDDLSLINPYAFLEPLAPYAAAKLEHRRVNLKQLDRAFERLLNRHEMLLVEGAGGILVPIRSNFFFTDLMKRWHTPALVVSRLGLGTINHTLLTCRYLMKAGISVVGVILNDTDGKPDRAARSNPGILRRHLDVPLLGVCPYIRDVATLSREQLADLAERSFDLPAMLALL
jgi:dethiobiotin synthetase